jgi:glutathione peroxidase
LVHLLATVLLVLGTTGCLPRREYRAEVPRLRIADSLFEFVLDDIHGRPYAFDQHAGQVMLLVNVASRCHFVGQYAALQSLHERFQARGLVVVAVPCNDFLSQEPGSGAEIQRFCSTTYGVTFPIMAKSTVTGKDISPLYWHLTGESARPGAIRWNFTKFLIGRDGRVVERFGPMTAPDAPAVVRAIEQALAPVPVGTAR